MCGNKFCSDWPIHYRGNTCRHTYGALIIVRYSSHICNMKEKNNRPTGNTLYTVTSEKRDEKWSVNPVLSADYW